MRYSAIQRWRVRRGSIAWAWKSDLTICQESIGKSCRFASRTRMSSLSSRSSRSVTSTFVVPGPFSPLSAMRIASGESHCSMT
ncbi:MAG: hypothetical protein IRY99_02820 [Isosphaeraceae bacterium]|nr:hypothetical protein [Isosphaeraceae bacterium]